VASLFYLGPPVTMIMAWITFGDTVSVMDIAGLCIVFIGVVLTQFNQREKNDPNESI
jgi:drug/metabolite transporter (DMT)-like permease